MKSSFGDGVESFAAPTQDESIHSTGLGILDSYDYREDNGIYGHAQAFNQNRSSIQELAATRGSSSEIENQPSFNISPLSSISKDDSSFTADREAETRIPSQSIFRPRPEAEIQRYGDPNSKMTLSEQHTGVAEKVIPHSITSQDMLDKPFRASRQVSMNETRTYTMKHSFDSREDDVHGRDPSRGHRDERDMPSHSDPKRRQGLADFPLFYNGHEDSNGSRADPNSFEPPLHEKDGLNNMAVSTPMKHPDQKHINYDHALRLRAKLFTDFTFPLPGVKEHIVEYLNSPQHHARRVTYSDVIAKRRLVSAVHAFGGNMCPRPSPMQDRNVSSIFRSKNNPLTMREKYDQKLLMRYYENESRLSWDVEEDPLVELGSIDDKSNETSERCQVVRSEGSNQTTSRQKYSKTDSNGNDEEDTGDTPRMRYRCKLCGQPKQNHVCPYRQPLQRSIATMSFPIVNAFQCKEPGKITPQLSEMNNFIDIIATDDDSDNEEVPTDDKGNDDESSPLKKNLSPKRELERVMSTSSSGYNEDQKRKRRRKTEDSGNVNGNFLGSNGLLHEPMELKPEQYRNVTIKKEPGDFTYPTLPLPFEQRKNNSSDLFELCENIAGLTEDCAKVLEAAKQTDYWDLAVAELITQILVVIHCPFGDEKLDGIRKYLFHMGISC